MFKVITMAFTDGIVIRCPDCGTLNILLVPYELAEIKKCLHCEGCIMPKDSIIAKIRPGVFE